MNDDIISKADLWADRIHAFQESGLSRKDWCQQNEIPQSTLGYWIRRLQPEALETECTATDPVFAKLPTEQELQFNSPAGTSCRRYLSRITSIGLNIGCEIEMLQNDKKRPLLIYGRDTMIALNRKESERVSVEVMN